jgi:predicted RNA polymerase sigma factor
MPPAPEREKFVLDICFHRATSGACPGFRFYEQTVLRHIGRLGRTAEAREAYERALALTRQEPERRFIERRVQALRDKEEGEGSRR